MKFSKLKEDRIVYSLPESSSVVTSPVVFETLLDGELCVSDMMAILWNAQALILIIIATIITPVHLHLHCQQGSNLWVENWFW